MPSDQVHSNPPIELGDTVVFSERALYETYNFHDPEHVERLADWLTRDERGDEPGVAVVAGQAGSGRDYIVRAAAWLAGKRGTRVRHVRLSFDGFDPDGKDAIADFARHQMRMHLARGEEDAPSLVNRQALLADLVDRIPVTSLGAALVSFLLKTALSVVDARALLRSTVPVLSGPRASGEERLRNLVDVATRDERLVLVLPADVMSEPAVQWFVHEPRRRRRLSVVLLMGSTPDETEIYGEPLAHVVEPRRIPQGSLRERVSHRFTPNTFPDRFFSGLWKRTQGVPGQVALAMMDLEHDELITRTDAPGRPWHLAVDADDEALVEYFASQFYEQLNQFRNQQKPVDRHLLRFVELAALCGSIAPPRLIASYMGLTSAERDDLLDRIDEVKDAGRPVFDSLDYQHPTVRNRANEPELVYRYADESNRLIVLQRMIHRVREAKSLLEYLSSQLPVMTRGNAEIFSTLADHLPPSSETREEYTRRLRWWTDNQEAAAFTDLLAEQVRAGRLSPGELLSQAQKRREWPAVRRLALLDAMHGDPDGIPMQLLPSYHYVRVLLLVETCRFSEGLEVCEAGLMAASPSEYEWRRVLHGYATHCAWVLNRLDDALQHSIGEYRVTTLSTASTPTTLGTAASHVATALIRLNRASEAGGYIDEAYAYLNEATGEDENDAGFMNELGLALSALGDEQRAGACFRRSLAAEEKWMAAGGVPREVYLVSLFNLANSLFNHDDPDGGYECLVHLADTASSLRALASPPCVRALVILFSMDMQRGNSAGLEKWAGQLREIVETGTPDVIFYLKDRTRSLISYAEEKGEGVIEISDPMQDLVKLLLEPEPGSAGLEEGLREGSW